VNCSNDMAKFLNEFFLTFSGGDWAAGPVGGASGCATGPGGGEGGQRPDGSCGVVGWTSSGPGADAGGWSGGGWTRCGGGRAGAGWRCWQLALQVVVGRLVWAGGGRTRWGWRCWWPVS
jgi:hypothetical protein